MPLVRALLKARQQVLALVQQERSVAVRDPPNDGVVDHHVCVRQLIAEVHDPLRPSDLCEDIWRVLAKRGGCLADDDELAFGPTSGLGGCRDTLPGPNRVSPSQLRRRPR